MKLDPLKWLAKLLPRDSNNTAGFGPFRLPKRCDWMQSVFEYHDHYYDVGPEAKMPLSEIEWRIFKALVIAAETEPNMIERCHRVHDICRYWPIMRSAGHYLYGRNHEN